MDPSEHTSIGHMQTMSKGIIFTCPFPTVFLEDEPEPPPEPITELTSNIHDVYTHCFENPL